MNCTRRLLTTGTARDAVWIRRMRFIAGEHDQRAQCPPLRDVQIVGLGFNSQTFLLTFDVSNPNPFPLPVNHVRYGVRLDGERFASGETPCDISVPASGATEVAISVELDLLKTSTAAVVDRARRRTQGNPLPARGRIWHRSAAGTVGRLSQAGVYPPEFRRILGALNGRLVTAATDAVNSCIAYTEQFAALRATPEQLNFGDAFGRSLQRA